MPKKGSGVHGLPQSTSATSHTTTNGPSSVGGASAASVATVDGRGSADGAAGAPPPAKRSRAAADTPSPASTPHSAKSPPLLEVTETVLSRNVKAFNFEGGMGKMRSFILKF